MIGGLSAAMFGAVGCSDWLEPESINRTDYNSVIMSEEDAKYFESLRQWKQTPDLPQVFVWFDSWSGASRTGASSLCGLPDSVTIASNWGLHGADTSKFDLSPERKDDMETVQKVKGTKVVVTFFSRFPGEGLPKSRFPHWYDENGEYIYLHKPTSEVNTTDEEIARPAIRRYVEDLYKACIETGYDGYDWDYEPGYGMDAPGGSLYTPFYYNRTQQKIFIEELSYWFGREAMNPNRDRGGRPMPEKRLLLLVDGAVGIGYGMDDNWLSYCIDHFVLQAYGGGSLNSRVGGVVKEVSTWIEQGKMTAEDAVKRTILTENFESYAGTGGGFLNMSKYIYKGSYNGQAMDQQIGGCGLYRVGFDFDKGTNDWKFLNQGITNIFRIYRERQNQTENE